MANTYLTRTPSSNGSKTTNTISLWLKRSNLSGGTVQRLFSQLNTGGSGNPDDYITFDDVDRINFQFYGDGTNGVNNGYLVTNRKFRDTSGWLHIVAVQDTTNNTLGDRLRLYINGVRETSFSTANYPSQNTQGGAINNTSYPLFIGQRGNNAGYFSGSMSHIHFIDGTAYDASAFGETDATTGEWVGKTSPSVTYGTNGFFILKDGNSVTDQSGRGNNFTVGGGTLTDLKDNPDNVFATMNALSKDSNGVLSKGNTVIRNDVNANANVLGTIALGNGKYYWENYRHGGGNIGCGLTLASVDGSNHSAIHGSRVNYYQNGYIYQNGFGLSDINTGVTYSDTDIIGVSVDTEGGTIKFYKNGALVNNSSQTNSAFTYAQNELIPFWYSENGGEWRTNLGNGYFGTTAVTTNSGNGYAGAEGASKFNYTVPTGYSALSTKGLNE